MDSVLETYGIDLTAKKFITNPAIARDEEIKRAMVILLTPEKSVMLIGKAGIGKTAIVEGVCYLMQQDLVPNALKGHKIISISSNSLLGRIDYNGVSTLVITQLIEELKTTEKVILFIDEIHTLIGANKDNALDIANMLKPLLDRGTIKLIGATTDIEYETYILKDRAFLRRFERIDVLEPNQEVTAEILYKSIPRIEHQTGIKMKYNEYTTRLLLKSIVSATDEFKRVYGLSSKYPDVAFSVLSQAFSSALYENKTEVNVVDFYNAIKVSRRIYPKNVIKELEAFRDTFKDLCQTENVVLPIVKIEELEADQIIL